MTFLEYVAERLLGPPVFRSSGRSYWLCPFHEERRPSFSTLPPKEGCKDRYRCFGCGAWGDEFDLMKLYFPDEQYPKRRVRLDLWRRDYRREVPQATQSTNSLRGLLGSIEGRSEPQAPRYRDDPRDVALVWANLIAELRDEETSEAFALQVLKQTVRRCEERSVSVPALLGYWVAFANWSVETDRSHLAECDDPECEAAVCRAERGLPPLTTEEIEGGRHRRNGVQGKNRSSSLYTT